MRIGNLADGATRERLIQDRDTASRFSWTTWRAGAGTATAVAAKAPIAKRLNRILETV